MKSALTIAEVPTTRSGNAIAEKDVRTPPSLADQKLGETTGLSREELALRIGEAALRLLEVVYDIPPTPQEPEYQLAVWRPLEGLLVKIMKDRECPQTASSPLEKLDVNEREAIEAYARESTSKDGTAAVLNINRGALDYRIEDAYRKLDIHDRNDVARIVPISRCEYQRTSLDVLNKLSSEEAEALGYVTLGASNHLIAQQVGVASHGVIANRLIIVYKTLGVRKRWDAYRKGMILKDMAGQAFIETVRQYPEPLPKAEIAKLRLPQLSSAQTQILALSAQDKTTAEIAIKMGTTMKRIDGYRSATRKKLGLSMEHEAVAAFGVESKILTLADFYDLDKRDRDALVQLNQRLSQPDPDQQTRKKLARCPSAIKRALGVRTSPIANLIVQTNRAVIEAGAASVYHQVGLTAIQIKSVRLFLQGMSPPDIQAALGKESSLLPELPEVLATLRINESNLIETSLLLEPPGKDLARNLDLSLLTYAERKIFLSLADNPSDAELVSENPDNASSPTSIVDHIICKLGLQNRLQVVRISKANQQICVELGRRAKFEKELGPKVLRLTERLQQRRLDVKVLAVQAARVLKDANIPSDEVNQLGNLGTIIAASMLKSEKHDKAILNPELRPVALSVVRSILAVHHRG